MRRIDITENIDGSDGDSDEDYHTDCVPFLSNEKVRDNDSSDSDIDDTM